MIRRGAIGVGLTGIGAYALVVYLAQATAPLISVRTLAANHARYHGKLVRVAGWMPEYGSLSNTLHLNSIILRDPSRAHWLFQHHRIATLTIGASRTFDRRAKPMIGHQVIVTGYFNEICKRGTVLCLDRYPELRPLWFYPPRLAAMH